VSGDKQTLSKKAEHRKQATLMKPQGLG